MDSQLYFTLPFEDLLDYSDLTDSLTHLLWRKFSIFVQSWEVVRRKGLVLFYPMVDNSVSEVKKVGDLEPSRDQNYYARRSGHRDTQEPWGMEKGDLKYVTELSENERIRILSVINPEDYLGFIVVGSMNVSEGDLHPSDPLMFYCLKQLGEQTEIVKINGVLFHDLERVEMFQEEREFSTEEGLPEIFSGRPLSYDPLTDLNDQRDTLEQSDSELILLFDRARERGVITIKLLGTLREKDEILAFADVFDMMFTEEYESYLFLTPKEEMVPLGLDGKWVTNSMLKILKGKPPTIQISVLEFLVPEEWRYLDKTKEKGNENNHKSSNFLISRVRMTHLIARSLASSEWSSEIFLRPSGLVDIPVLSYEDCMAVISKDNLKKEISYFWNHPDDFSEIEYESKKIAEENVKEGEIIISLRDLETSWYVCKGPIRDIEKTHFHLRVTEPLESESNYIVVHQREDADRKMFLVGERRRDVIEDVKGSVDNSIDNLIRDSWERGDLLNFWGKNLYRHTGIITQSGILYKVYY